MRRVNPYEAEYHKLNIPISKNISKENAEEIARHLGYLHNTFGLVAKDLIKILSFNFPSEVIQPNKNHQRASNENSVRPSDQIKRRVENNGRMIQIQNSGSNYREEVNSNQIIFHKKRKDNVVVQIRDDDNQENANDQSYRPEEQIPNYDFIGQLPYEQSPKQSPNYDFLGQFAYDTAGIQQDKNNTLNNTNNILKAHLSKVIEKVSTKKKKESTNNQYLANIQKPPSPTTNNRDESMPNPTYFPKISSGPFTSNNKLTFGSQNNKNVQQEIHNSNAGDINEQPSFLQEFQYKSAEKIKPQPLSMQPSKVQNQVERPNKLWSLMRQKQAPEIFQISDDD